jgi:hypothetical protein
MFTDESIKGDAAIVDQFISELPYSRFVEIANIVQAFQPKDLHTAMQIYLWLWSSKVQVDELASYLKMSVAVNVLKNTGYFLNSKHPEHAQNVKKFESFLGKDVRRMLRKERLNGIPEHGVRLDRD